MFRLFSIIFLACSISCVSLGDASSKDVPPCKEVLENLAGKLQSSKWEFIGQLPSSFFVFAVVSPNGNPGAIVVVSDPIAGELYQAAKESKVIQIHQEKTCQIDEVSYLVLLLLEEVPPSI